MNNVKNDCNLCNGSGEGLNENDVCPCQYDDINEAHFDHSEDDLYIWGC